MYACICVYICDVSMIRQLEGLHHRQLVFMIMSLFFADVPQSCLRYDLYFPYATQGCMHWLMCMYDKPSVHIVQISSPWPPLTSQAANQVTLQNTLKRVIAFSDRGRHVQSGSAWCSRSIIGHFPQFKMASKKAIENGDNFQTVNFGWNVVIIPSIVHSHSQRIHFHKQNDPMLPFWEDNRRK